MPLQLYNPMRCKELLAFYIGQHSLNNIGLANVSVLVRDRNKMKGFLENKEKEKEIKGKRQL